MVSICIICYSLVECFSSLYALCRKFYVSAWSMKSRLSREALQCEQKTRATTTKKNKLRIGGSMQTSKNLQLEDGSNQD